MNNRNEIQNTFDPNRDVLFIGNGINNLRKNNNWAKLVQGLQQVTQSPNPPKDLKSNFPLVYENYLWWGLNNRSIQSEKDLKTLIKNFLQNIKVNSIHKRIFSLKPKHIITSNYDFVLEQTNTPVNASIIKETRYSVFRKYSGRIQNVWHVHGDCHITSTITLGYEQYSGQLQALRNYVATGTNYASKNVPPQDLIQRLKNNAVNYDSWVDFFYKNDIHIIGLRLDFIEIDLWWLLTYWARQRRRNGDIISNRIIYYIPEKHAKKAMGKIDLLRNLGVEVIISKRSYYNYYHALFDYFQGKISKAAI